DGSIRRPRTLELKFTSWRGRRAVPLLMTGLSLLLALMSIATLHRSEDGGVATVTAQSQPNQNGVTKTAENQFVTSASQEAKPEQQKAAGSAVSSSSIQQNRFASASSDKNLRQPVFQYPATDRVAKRDGFKVEKGSQNKDEMVDMISPR